MTVAAGVIDRRRSAAVFAVEQRLCLHCGSATGAGGDFCCGGCAGAYTLVQELGLGQYYARRTADATPAAVTRSAEIGELAHYVVTAADGTSTLNLLVDGIHCAACVWLIETALRRRPELVEARVNLTSRRLRLRWRGGVAEAAALVELVSRLGYRLAPFDATRLAAADSGAEKELLLAMAVAGFAAGNVMLLSVAVWSGNVGEMGGATRDLLHWLSALIALPAIVYAGRPFFRSALAALRARRTNMDVPISVGVILAAAMSLFETAHSGVHAYFDSAITLLFFLLVGRYLDSRARGRARSASEHLLGLNEASAGLVGADGEVRRVPANALVVGDTILVPAGERIAADGRVAFGTSSLDNSLIDGESLPRPVAAGATVYAGVLNLTAPLRVTVGATGDKTLLAEIVRLMEAAEQGRARFVVLADRIARRYAPAVHLLSLATFIGWIGFVAWQQALLNAVAVLIITCPFALGLAVPVVQIVAGGRLLRRGILLKSATALERLAEIDTVVFDKTGTLTLGRLQLADLEIDPVALRVAATLAAASSHPLSKALCRACASAPVADGVREVPGQGLAMTTADGETRLGSRDFCGVAESDEADGPELWLVQPRQVPHRFVFADALRPDAAEVIAKLQSAGKRVVLLSGDRQAVVAATAERLGIAEWQSAVTPAGKCRRLAELAADGAKVMMVGDGLNDAPALAAAHVSASPASAADISQNAADIVFQGASLAAISEILEVADRSESLVRQNIALAIGYNALAVPLAMLGYVTPLIAAVAMSTSSLIVVGNALRLGRVNRKAKRQ
jgi:P-type Cu2+ transporter